MKDSKKINYWQFFYKTVLKACIVINLIGLFTVSLAKPIFQITTPNASLVAEAGTADASFTYLVTNDSNRTMTQMAYFPPPTTFSTVATNCGRTLAVNETCSVVLGFNAPTSLGLLDLAGLTVCTLNGNICSQPNSNNLVRMNVVPSTSNKVYVVNQDSNNVSVIDTTTDTVVDTVAVGNLPRGSGVSPNGTRVFVTNRGGDSVSIINTATDTVLSEVDVGNVPTRVAFTPNSAKAYVPNNGAPLGISVVDVASETLLSFIPITGLADPTTIPTLASTPDGTKIYAARLTTDNVDVIDTATDTVTATIAVGNSPRAVAITPDGTKVYVTNTASHTVSVISTATNTVTATVAVQFSPRGMVITPDGSKAYVANRGSDSVSVIDVATDTVTSNVSILPAEGPENIAITPDGTKVYTANEDTNNVSAISTATDTLTGNTAAQASTPNAGLAVTADSSKVYVPFSGGIVQAISTATDTVVATINVGNTPRSIVALP